MRYLTDGTTLYEVCSERADVNYGLMGGTFSTLMIRDVISEQTATIDDLHLAALTEVP